MIDSHTSLDNFCLFEFTKFVKNCRIAQVQFFANLLQIQGLAFITFPTAGPLLHWGWASSFRIESKHVVEFIQNLLSYSFPNLPLLLLLFSFNAVVFLLETSERSKRLHRVGDGDVHSICQHIRPMLHLHMVGYIESEGVAKRVRFSMEIDQRFLFLLEMAIEHQYLVQICWVGGKPITIFFLSFAKVHIRRSWSNHLMSQRLFELFAWFLED